MAERWSDGNEKCSQVSIFFPEGNAKVSYDEIENISSYIDSLLSENSDGNNRWKDCFSTYPQSVDVSKYNSSDTLNMNALGVNSSFFSFHPLELIDGNYLYNDSLNIYSAVIDEEAAWNIFFSLNVAGMRFYIGEVEFYVQGVIKKDDIAEARSVYPDKPIVYLDYRAMNELFPDIPTLCYEAVIPESHNNYAKNLLLGYYNADSFQEENSAENLFCEIIDNTKRLSFSSSVENMLHYAHNGVVTRPIIYPYWENSVRVLINKLNVIIFIILLLAAYILFVSAAWIIKKYKNRKWKLSNFTNKLIIKFTYKNK